MQIMQTPLLHGVFLGVVSFRKHHLGSAKIDICGSEIVQGLIVTLVVVVVHKAGKLAFQVSGSK